MNFGNFHNKFHDGSHLHSPMQMSHGVGFFQGHPHLL